MQSPAKKTTLFEKKIDIDIYIEIRRKKWINHLMIKNFANQVAKGMAKLDLYGDLFHGVERHIQV